MFNFLTEVCHGQVVEDFLQVLSSSGSNICLTSVHFCCETQLLPVLKEGDKTEPADFALYSRATEAIDCQGHYLVSQWVPRLWGKIISPVLAVTQMWMWRRDVFISITLPLHMLTLLRLCRGTSGQALLMSHQTEIRCKTQSIVASTSIMFHIGQEWRGVWWSLWLYRGFL